MVSDSEDSHVVHDILESDTYKNIPCDLKYATELEHVGSIRKLEDLKKTFDETNENYKDARVIVICFHDPGRQQLYKLLVENKVIHQVLQLYP